MLDPASDDAQDNVEKTIMRIALATSTAVLTAVVSAVNSVDKDSGIDAIFTALPQENRRIGNLLRSFRKTIGAEERKLLADAAAANDEWAEKFYRANGVSQTPWHEHDTISDYLDEVASDCADVADRPLFIVLPSGRQVPLDNGVRRSMLQTSTSGDSRRDAVIAAIVAALALHGLRVDRGDGTSERFESSVTNRFMHGYREFIYEVRKVQGIEFGADGVQLSAHGDSAPDHVPYQGGMYTLERFEEIQADLPREYVTGAGCRHFTWPVVIGVDKPAYTDDELEEMYRSSVGEVSYHGLSGKPMVKTGYEWSQYRRSIEGRCRELSTRLELLRQTGDQGAVERTRQELARVRAYYSGLSDATAYRPAEWRTRTYTVR